MNMTFVGWEPPDQPGGKNTALAIFVNGPGDEIERLKKDLLKIKDTDEFVIALLKLKPLGERMWLLGETVAERLGGK